jgi:hypothetical protein
VGIGPSLSAMASRLGGGPVGLRVAVAMSGLAAVGGLLLAVSGGV